MRAKLFVVLLSGSLLTIACSNQAAKVERESAERSMLEAFDNQFDTTGVLQYSHPNGERVFFMQCAGCHGEEGTKQSFSRENAPHSLGASARANPRTFWHSLYFGRCEGKMPEFGKKIAFQDLVDVSGFVMRLP